MKILVYGAGAVGGYLTARLMQNQHDVTVVTRQVTADAIHHSGLFVVDSQQTIHVHPTAVTSIAQAFLDEQTRYDLIILGMKAYDMAAALDPLVAFCPQPPPIITTQNGINIEDYVTNLFGPDQIISGAVTVPINRETINRLIVERDDRGMALAPIKPNHDIKKWLHLFHTAGITVKGIKDYQSMKWSKALLNIVGNATSAILNRPPEIVYKSDVVYNLEIRMLKEMLAVMNKRKIKVVDLPGAPTKQLANGVKRMPKFLLKPLLTGNVARGRGDKMPSFYLDLSSGKGKSEVVYHNGAVARIGEQYGIYTPVNKALSEILLQLTHEEVNWREYDGKPKRLLAEVKRYAQQMK